MPVTDSHRKRLLTIQDAWVSRVQNSRGLYNRWKRIVRDLIMNHPFRAAAQIQEQGLYDGVCTLFLVDDAGTSRWAMEYLPPVQSHQALINLILSAPPSHILKELLDLGAFNSIRAYTLESLRWDQLQEQDQAFLLQMSLSMVRFEEGSHIIGEDDIDVDTFPAQEISLQPFLLSQYPVTQGLYLAVTGENPSHFTGMSRPVESVSWFEALRFCNRLSQLQGLQPCYRFTGISADSDGFEETTAICDFSAKGYRLPSELEWEAASRSGHGLLFAGDINSDNVGWFAENSDSKTHAVGQKMATPKGLFDMSGNVAEWCWERFGWEKDIAGQDAVTKKTPLPDGALPDTLRIMLGLPLLNPPPAPGELPPQHIIRGGGWVDAADASYVTRRHRVYPTACEANMGFRLAMSAE